MAEALRKKKKTKAKQSVTSEVSLEERIRRLAYRLYEERGMQDGEDIGDWLRAEEIASKPEPAPKSSTARIKKATVRKTAKSA